MLGAPIYFSEQEMTNHITLSVLCVKTLGQMNISSNHPITNQIPGPGQPLSEVLKTLNEKITECFRPTQELQDQLFQIFTINQEFSHVLQNKFTEVFTLCNYISFTLYENRKQIDPQHYHDLASHFILLTTVLSFNAAVAFSANGDSEALHDLLKANQHWMQQLEIDNLGHINNPIFESLRQRFFKHTLAMEREIVKALLLPNLLPEELNFHIDHKNARSRDLGSSYQGLLVQHPESTLFYIPDDNAISQLMSTIKELCTSGESCRRSILFYYNNDLGHVELIDVSFNAQRNHLDLINITSATNSSQHILLRKIIIELNAPPFTYQIYACQAKLQHDGRSCPLYSKALSNILSKLSIEHISQDQFSCSQPLFCRSAYPQGIELTKIDQVQWFDIRALGDKAIMMAQSFTHMKTLFNSMYDEEQAKEKINYFKRKYNLKDGATLSDKTYYPDILRQKQLKKYRGTNFNDLTIDKLKRKYKADDDGHLVRKGSAGLCTMNEFRFLIETFSQQESEESPFDAADKIQNKGFTPLHWAIQKDQHKRAAMLIKYGNAKIDIPDNTTNHQTAQDCYEKAPEESKVKKNPVLRTFLGR